jgi:hypothetical protein
MVKIHGHFVTQAYMCGVTYSFPIVGASELWKSSSSIANKVASQSNLPTRGAGPAPLPEPLYPGPNGPLPLKRKGAESGLRRLRAIRGRLSDTPDLAITGLRTTDKDQVDEQTR